MRPRYQGTASGSALTATRRSRLGLQEGLLHVVEERGHLQCGPGLADRRHLAAPLAEECLEAPSVAEQGVAAQGGTDEALRELPVALRAHAHPLLGAEPADAAP